MVRCTYIHVRLRRYKGDLGDSDPLQPFCLLRVTCFYSGKIVCLLLDPPQNFPGKKKKKKTMSVIVVQTHSVIRFPTFPSFTTNHPKLGNPIFSLRGMLNLITSMKSPLT